MADKKTMQQVAAELEAAHFTTGHPAYRAHLEHWRTLLCEMALTLAEDSAQTSRWLRVRRPRVGAASWADRFFLSIRLRGHGKNAADAVLEAAKDLIRMAAVHQEYTLLEASKATDGKPASRSGRYRTEDV
ncbi:hypothetical protein AB0395_46235 [Streptosporangium sp. NPDC051023]|uniref:hypothetical protein n=1 Tax=Streptosporangium sp. NPDC051023 TaxID=3155410 RepID=UPI00344B6BCD